VILCRKTSVITPDGFIAGKYVARWSTLFYRSLAEGAPLTVSYDRATRITAVPMSLLLHKGFALRADA
jgi:hypothetical protein